MTRHRGFKQKLAHVSRLWDSERYDAALVEVEALLQAYPGNAHLHVLWASLVQLQEEPSHELGEARQALQQAIELDNESPSSLIEYAQYLDAVEDAPQQAGKLFGEAANAARQLLIEALIGQARAFQQLKKKDDFRRCLVELLHLTRWDAEARKWKNGSAADDVIFESPTGHFYAVQLTGPYAKQIQEILSESSTQQSDAILN